MIRNGRGKPRLDTTVPRTAPRSPAVCVTLPAREYDSAYALARQKRVSLPQVLRVALTRFMRDERGGTL